MDEKDEVYCIIEFKEKHQKNLIQYLFRKYVHKERVNKRKVIKKTIINKIKIYYEIFRIALSMLGVIKWYIRGK